MLHLKFSFKHIYGQCKDDLKLYEKLLFFSLKFYAFYISGQKYKLSGSQWYGYIVLCILVFEPTYIDRTSN